MGCCEAPGHISVVHHVPSLLLLRSTGIDSRSAVAGHVHAVPAGCTRWKGEAQQFEDSRAGGSKHGGGESWVTQGPQYRGQLVGQMNQGRLVGCIVLRLDRLGGEEHTDQGLKGWMSQETQKSDTNVTAAAACHGQEKHPIELGRWSTSTTRRQNRGQVRRWLSKYISCAPHGAEACWRMSPVIHPACLPADPILVPCPDTPLSLDQGQRDIASLAQQDTLDFCQIQAIKARCIPQGVRAAAAGCEP